MPLTLEYVAKLSHNREGLRAAYAAGVDHQQNGWLRYPPCKWSNPAILAFDANGQCVGGINWGEDHDDRILTITFAWSSPSNPSAFAAVLSRFRKTHLTGWFTEIHFMISAHNDAMKKAVRILNLQPKAFTYEMSVADMKPRRAGTDLGPELLSSGEIDVAEEVGDHFYG
jgi:hypothetical protein